MELDVRKYHPVSWSGTLWHPLEGHSCGGARDMISDAFCTVNFSLVSEALHVTLMPPLSRISTPS